MQLHWHWPFKKTLLTWDICTNLRTCSVKRPCIRIVLKYDRLRQSTITLASLVKGRWIDGKAQTVDLLRLLAVYPPFYTTSFSAVKTEGLSRNPRLYQPFQNRTILRKALYPCPPSKKGEVLLLGQAEPTMVGIVNALVVFMVVLLSIPIPSHRTTPSKTALSHSLFVGRGACPSRNITAIIENKLIELYCKT